VAKPWSFLQRLEVDEASFAHRCQHGAAHHIAAGQREVKLGIGRAAERLCVACALAAIDRDIAWLQQIRQQLEEGE
jgi:hypothetical protein